VCVIIYMNRNTTNALLIVLLAACSRSHSEPTWQEYLHELVDVTDCGQRNTYPDGKEVLVTMNNGDCIALSFAWHDRLSVFSVRTAERRDKNGNTTWQTHQEVSSMIDVALAAKKPAGATLRGGDCDDACLVINDDRVLMVLWCTGKSGALVMALSARDGSLLWAKRVIGLGRIAHSRYTNNVKARLAFGNLAILGAEDCGKYLEVIGGNGELVLNHVLD
jgi:hypothetical protein